MRWFIGGFVAVGLMMGLPATSSACSFNCGGTYQKGNEFGLKAPAHSGYKAHSFFIFQSENIPTNTSKTKMARVPARHISGLKFGMGIVFQRQTAAEVIAKKIENVLNSLAVRFKSPWAGNAMGTA